MPNPSVTTRRMLSARLPSWYLETIRPERYIEEICWQHSVVCERVESLLISKPLEPEQVAAREKDWELRNMKKEQVLLKWERSVVSEELQKDEEEDSDDLVSKPDTDWGSLLSSSVDRVEQTLPPFKVGDTHNISSLLSSPLLQEQSTTLSQKMGIRDVLIYFWRPSDDKLNPDDYSDGLNVVLKELYSVYNPKEKFEVVFVAFVASKDVFDASFSEMPWLAVPHKNQEARDFLTKNFAIPYSASATPVLFDPNGKVLSEHATSYFLSYGVYGFPFTKERINDIWREARALWDQLSDCEKDKPSWTTLFGEYIISPEGNKVLTSELEGKTVGLFFLELSPFGSQRTRELLNIWKQLKDMHFNNFEIVVASKDILHLSLLKREFETEFGYSVPWYSPSDHRQLCLVFQHCGRLWEECDFIILEGDRYQSLSYFALEIMKVFGIEAYPFTLERAVAVAKGKQKKELKLSHLLSPSASLWRGSSSEFKEKTTVSKLFGKRVLLVFANYLCFEFVPFLRALKGIYRQKKRAVVDFEIIYISLDCDESPSSFFMSIEKMPWWVHSLVPDFGIKLVQKLFVDIFPPELPAVAAFGPDGHLEAKASNLAFKEEWESTYPFIDDMDEEVHGEIIQKHKWVLETPLVSSAR